MIKTLYEHSTKKSNEKKHEPICIEQMTFLKTVGTNGTLTTMVWGKAGREQNPLPSESFMQLFDNLAKLVDFRNRFGVQWIFKGFPTSTVFEQHRNTMRAIRSKNGLEKT